MFSVSVLWVKLQTYGNWINFHKMKVLIGKTNTFVFICQRTPKYVLPNVFSYRLIVRGVF